MSNHSGDANKMVSETPRTDEVNQYLRTRRDYTKTDHEVWMNHGIQLERELNAANAKIKWLEEAFDAAEGLIAVNSCGCPYDGEVFHCSSCVQAINRYIKLKRSSRER